MTNEQKAKAYDEALERARKQRDDYQKELDKTDKNSQLASLLRAGISAVEMIFPQLREIEDERIRIKRIEHFKAKTKKTWCNMPVKDIIAYLEKQKEQKLAEWNELQSEFRSINEAFEDGKKEVIANPEKYGLCKHEEWSDEDKAFLKVAIAICNRYSHKDIADWLKSLPERFNLQSKPEWSEMDELMMKAVIGILDERDHPKLCSFLKSLPLRCPKSSDNWKPSEEQMEALNKAIPVCMGVVGRDAVAPLESLCEQLERLM